MATNDPINLEQPSNNLSTIADKIRKDLVVRNDYKPSKNEYGVTNPDAISDGDDKGKGTGIFLDSANGGSRQDQIERKEDIKINKYNSSKPYQFPSTE